MKKICFRSIFITLLVGMLSSLNSCIKEDLSECPDGVRIIVKTDTETYQHSPDRYNNIENVTIYVFDENNRFVTAWEGGAYTHGNVYAVTLPLEKGKYKFVAWTNQGEIYKISHSIIQCQQTKPLLSELYLYVDYPQDKYIRDIIPDLHYGDLSDIVVGNARNNEHTIILKPNTYKLNFAVQGLPVDTDQYGFQVKDNNSHYGFDNSILSGKEEFNYIRTTGFAAGELKESLIELKLDHGRNTVFTFSNVTKNEVLYSGSLIGMINRAYTVGGQAVDFSKIYEFDITLSFDSNMNVSISINGWDYQVQSGELE